MSTIVMNGGQERTPWWANLAVNVLGGLWNDYQQREANKKANAYYGELMNQLSPTGNDTQQTGQSGGLMSTPTAQGLQNAPLPEGYNSNGWAGAFHENNSPLAQFDTGIAGLLGSPATQANAPTVPTQTPAKSAGGLPTAADIYRAAMGLAGTKRFAMINPEMVQKMITPFITASEAARMEQMRNDAANAYLNAGDNTSMLNQLYASTIQGVTPQSVLSSAQDRYKYDNPHLQQYSQNTGATTRFGGFNPRTGEFTQAGEFQNTLSPQEAARLAEQASVREQNQRQFDATMAYNREGRAWEQDYKNRQLEAEGNQPTGQIILGNDGYQYQFLKNGTQRRVTDTPGLTAQEDVELKNNEKQVNALTKQLQEQESSRRVAISRGLDTTEYDNTIKEIRTIIDTLNERSSQIITSATSRQVGNGRQNTNTPSNDTSHVASGMDIGANMLGVTGKSPITTAFNTPRKKKDGTPYNHAGVDYAMAKDTPIRLDDVGTTMKVLRVANDPDGYGNYVDIGGELTDKDGKKHTIGMRFAHMGNGTVAVTKGQTLNFGDIIGKVGNTGNSRGKNGGYHLHLETTIDGKRVDPTTFKSLISQYVPYTKNLQPNTFTGTTVQPKARVQTQASPISGDVTPTAPTASTAVTPDMAMREASQDVKPLETEVPVLVSPDGSTKLNFSEIQRIAGERNVTEPEIFNELWANGWYTPQQQIVRNSNPTRVASAQPSWNEQMPALIGFTNAGGNPYDFTMPGATATAQEDNGVQKALAELNDEFNTWDYAYRQRYPFASQSEYFGV